MANKKWNLTQQELDAIAARKGNFKQEDFCTTLSEARHIVNQRKVRTNKTVYIMSCPGGFVVNTHGVEKIGWKTIETL